MSFAIALVLQAVLITENGVVFAGENMQEADLQQLLGEFVDEKWGKATLKRMQLFVTQVEPKSPDLLIPHVDTDENIGPEVTAWIDEPAHLRNLSFDSFKNAASLAFTNASEAKIAKFARIAHQLSLDGDSKLQLRVLLLLLSYQVDDSKLRKRFVSIATFCASVRLFPRGELDSETNRLELAIIDLLVTASECRALGFYLQIPLSLDPTWEGPTAIELLGLASKANFISPLELPRGAERVITVINGRAVTKTPAESIVGVVNGKVVTYTPNIIAFKGVGIPISEAVFYTSLRTANVGEFDRKNLELSLKVIRQYLLSASWDKQIPADAVRDLAVFAARQFTIDSEVCVFDTFIWYSEIKRANSEISEAWFDAPASVRDLFTNILIPHLLEPEATFGFVLFDNYEFCQQLRNSAMEWEQELK